MLVHGPGEDAQRNEKRLRSFVFVLLISNSVLERRLDISGHKGKRE